MPRIPRSSAGSLGVGATQLRGAGLAPTPVDSVPGAMPTANGKSGSGFGGIADLAEVFNKAQRENEIQKGRVSAFSALRDYTTSIEQDPDAKPDNLVTKYDEGTETLRKNLLEQYKNNEGVLNGILPHFENMISEKRQHIRTLSFKRTVDEARADGMVNDVELMKAIEEARTPKDYDWALQLHADDVESKRATGVYGAVEAEQRKLHFSAKVNEVRKIQIEEERLKGVYGTLGKQFGRNPHAAVKFLENTENWGSLGIDYKDALHFITEFDKQAARDKRRADEGRAAGERAEMSAYWKAVDAGEYEKASGILSNARNISGERLVNMKKALKEDKWTDDPKVVADVQRRIWTGELVEPNELVPYMGNGLSPKTASTLRGDVEKIGKEAPEFPGAMNFYANALNSYGAQFKDTPLAEHEGKFAATLSFQARQRKIGPYDPRMDALADELLAVVEKPWFGADKTRFQQQFEAKSLPGVPTDATMPPPLPAQRQAPAPTAKPSSMQQIPRAEYEMVKAALSKAGRDTSDETVLSVWLANRDKLKGSK